MPIAADEPTETETQHKIQTSSQNIPRYMSETSFRHEYNRTFHHIGYVTLLGALQIDDKYKFRTGFSYGEVAGGADVKAFASATAAPFHSLRNLDFTFAAVYNGLPKYEMRSLALLPIVSYRYTGRSGREWGGISCALTFRFTSFFDEAAIFEYLGLFSLYYNIIRNERMRLALSVGNLDEFYVGSVGVRVPKLITEVRIRRDLQIISELDYLQSGNDSFTAVFYGFAWRMGVRKTW